MFIVKYEPNANTAIFCEGEIFSFKEIIDTRCKTSKSLNFGFHGSNSRYFVRGIKNMYQHYYTLREFRLSFFFTKFVTLLYVINNMMPRKNSHISTSKGVPANTSS